MLGLCPQFNILHGNLTVEEHVFFFAKVGFSSVLILNADLLCATYICNGLIRFIFVSTFVLYKEFTTCDHCPLLLSLLLL